MLKLHSLEIENYKNLVSIRLNPSNRFVCFTGENGAGKTNLLDTIHYISLAKSYFSNTEYQNIRFNQDFFHLKTQLHRSGESFEVTCGFIRGDKKVIRRNGEPYTRLSEHVGEFPVVIITPYDIELILGGSEERRRFIDILVSQMDKQYLESLVQYSGIIKQRNLHLKSLAEKKSRDTSLLEVYNEQMKKPGWYIYQQRKAFSNQFRDYFNDYYSRISDAGENVGITYISQLNEQPLEELLKRNMYNDIREGRTTCGPHRDDFELLIGGHPVKKFGSQGQQKSFLIALKLAEYYQIRSHKGFRPLLLLDDVFDKLDNKRISRLMNIISGEEFGQVFLTDTDEERIKTFFSQSSEQLQILRINKGNLTV